MTFKTQQASRQPDVTTLNRIADKLTVVQQSMVANKLVQLAKQGYIPNDCDWHNAIVQELLNKQSFTKSEQDFVRKLNTIAALIKKHQWQPPQVLKDIEPTRVIDPQVYQRRHLEAQLCAEQRLLMLDNGRTPGLASSCHAKIKQCRQQLQTQQSQKTTKP